MRKITAHTGIPVVTSLMGYGCVSPDDENFFGMIGMHGTYAGNLSTTEADLMIGLGARFDDRVTGLLAEFASKAKIVHFDIDPAEINKNLIADIRVVGDLRWSLQLLLEKVLEVPAELWARQVRPWKEQLLEWQKDKPLTYNKETRDILPQQVIERISELTDGKAVIATDVGQHQMWTAQFYQFKNPRTLLTSGGLGTMGYGLPAALGAQVGVGDKEVVCICGDGGFMMNCQELSTLADLNLPVKIILLNNGYLGMVAQWQRAFYNAHYAFSCMKTKTDYVQLSEAMGVPAVRIGNKEEFEQNFDKYFRTKGPILIELSIPETEDVLPMVPSGARLDQMIMGG